MPIICSLHPSCEKTNDAPAYLRYGLLNVDGVRDAIISVPLNRPNDQEKQDRTVAKAILDNMGFEKEKYRLGYTKVLSQTYLSLSYPNWSCPLLTVKKSNFHQNFFLCVVIRSTKYRGDWLFVYIFLLSYFILSVTYS